MPCYVKKGAFAINLIAKAPFNLFKLYYSFLCVEMFIDYHALYQDSTCKYLR